MSKLISILDVPMQQMSLDTLLATLEAEEGCEFEALCQQELAEKRKPGAKPPQYPYRCGWLATNIEWCAKRRKYLKGDD